MKRRKFIQMTGTGALAVPVSTYAHTWTLQDKNTAEVIVVGAGTFGVWTAYHLQRMGAQVTLVDAYGPGNSRASSGGETRLIQTNSANPLYVQSALRAFGFWKELEERSGETLVLPTGALNMSTSESYRETVFARKKQHLSVGIKNTEVLDRDEIRYRWPQIYSDDIAVAMYHDGGASGSTILARKAIQMVVKEFEKEGGKLIIAHGKPIISKGKVEGIDIGKNRVLKAAQYVFACGPWLPKLFPELLLPKLQVQRRDVLFVGTPAGDNRFSYPNMPEWGITGSGYYGFADIQGRGFKVAPYPDHNPLDPDRDERIVNPYQAKRAHDFVAKRFPDLKDQPIIESRVCQVTNSTDMNFIVDHIPGTQNAWIIGGGSGHGFKHGPSVGEFASLRLLDKEANPAFTKLYTLKEAKF